MKRYKVSEDKYLRIAKTIAPLSDAERIKVLAKLAELDAQTQAGVELAPIAIDSVVQELLDEALAA